MTIPPDAQRLRYRVREIDVAGGPLHVGVWGPDAPGGGTPVVAVHGITASHLSWQWLAAARPDLRLIAPDLRGRGASATLPGPWGLARHADDVAALLTAVGVPVTLVGHSMGGFVAALTAAAHPELVARVVLVDGGLPLVTPPGMDVTQAVRLGLGPALARLSMVFPDRAAYRRFWREHPALTAVAGPELDAYADHDLEPAPDGWRSRVRADAVAADSADQFDQATMLAALRRLPAGSALLTAPAGLDGSPPPLYSQAPRDRVLSELALTLHEVPSVNHYTIVMGPGVQTLAGLLC